MQTKLAPGGLIDGWQRLSEILLALHERIAEEAKNSAHLHAAETGRRINSQGCSPRRFANSRAGSYMIDRFRGRPALQKLFTEILGRCFDRRFLGTL